MNIGRKIRLGFFLVLILSALAGLTGVQSTRSLNHDVQSLIDESIPVLHELQALRGSGLELVLGAQSLLFPTEVRAAFRNDNATLSHLHDAMEGHLKRYLALVQTRTDGASGMSDPVDEASGKLLETCRFVLSQHHPRPGERPASDVLNALREDTQAFLFSVDDALRHETESLNSQRAKAQSVLSASVRNWLGIGLVAFIVAGILGYAFSRMVTDPLARLTRAAEDIGRGEVGKIVEYSSKDELGKLVSAMNDMSRDLMIARDELAAERSYSEDVLASMADSLFILSGDGAILRANLTALNLLGFDESELLGRNLSVLISGGLNLSQMTVREGFKGRECRFVTKDRSEVPVLLSASVLSGAGRRKDAIVCVATDISARKLAEDQILYMAYHDALTSLPNRALFQDRLGLAMAQADRLGKLVAVFFIGLDHFKQINETLGHQIGDLVLQAVAERLQDCVRKVDTIARLDTGATGDSLARMGGDEFTILSMISHAEDAVKVARRILELLPEPLGIEGHEIYPSASIGIAIYPVDARSPEEMITNADTAMHSAKEQGKNSYKFFKHAMNVAAFKRLSLESSLRKALERNEFVLFYQPQLDVEKGEVIGLEALIRWRHPDMGMVSPDEFIPLAEETGLIGPIGEWVIREACRQNRIWQNAGYRPVTVSVNLSSRQFRGKNLSVMMEKILTETDLQAEHFGLEITESIVMQDTASTIAILHRLHSMGLKLSVDDFGTGYSSLSYLKKFPLHAIKIDRTFTRDLITNPDDAAIARAITAMAIGLKLRVIAEGVETREQLVFLRANGCHEIQGFLLSRPIPAEEVVRILDPGSASTHDGLMECRRVLGMA